MAGSGILSSCDLMPSFKPFTTRLRISGVNSGSFVAKPKTVSGVSIPAKRLVVGLRPAISLASGVPGSALMTVSMTRS